jgi:hypothetical protein
MKHVKSGYKVSKQGLQPLLHKIGADLNPTRVSVKDGDKTIRVFQVRWDNKTLLFPSLKDVFTWAVRPEAYDPARKHQPVDAIPVDWILDPTDDPVKPDPGNILNL